MENATLNASTEVPTLRPSADDVTSAPVDESVQLLTTTTHRLWSVFPPVLLAVGTCGNALSIAVLSGSSMRRSNAAFYLTVLAVVDTMALNTGLLRLWLFHLTEVDIRELSTFVCKFHSWIVYVTLDISVWIVVAFTCERLISVCLPHDVKRHCNEQTSCISLSIIAVVLMAINSHFIYGLGIEYTKTIVTVSNELDHNRQVTVPRCVPLGKEYEHFYNMVWPWIDLCIFSLLPLLLIVVCNSVIIIKIFESRRKARRIIPSVASSTHPGVQADDTRSRKVSSMTGTLMTLNLVLLLTTMPICAYHIVEPYYATIFDESSEQYDPKVTAQFKLAWAIVNMLMYINNSINFLLYCLSGTRFREELSNLILRKRYSLPVTPTQTYQSARIQA
ncbi:FMRFamide receptor-like isoform X1 [Pomacea canaliculata]|uniref:FMRFamide receptor-like isoform X1 n=1 Tax=Pomacea canaliculata TaxID=400727 RepID=UPI000D728085|nr:FMRFamide receptor-like isoform X1 [Pomacea canaliculata]XP_025077660.1 FMRFamide receptor-like isoform X1 [Pomacea canaliculata]XP_025077661.1 FMRFamide receptor-like isoform X1 [Pomacea canaliculata]XP_025077662.1 FMRFamide receptor-like isoform X1 [Pomacea canaliculata]